MLLNYIESKTFELSIYNTVIDFDYTSLGEKHYELRCCITPKKKFENIGELIQLLKKTIGRVSGNTDTINDLISFVSNTVAHIISFKSDGITLVDLLTVDYTSIIFIIERKEGETIRTNIELDGVRLNLGTNKGMDLSSLGINNLDVDIKGWLQIYFDKKNTPSFLFTVDEKSDQLEAFSIPIPLIKDKLKIKLDLFCIGIKKNLEKYEVYASGSVSLAGGPSYIKPLLPKSTEFTLALNSKNVSLTIPTIFKNKDIGLPKVPDFADADNDTIWLGDLLIDIEDVTISFGEKKGISFNSQLGLPHQLNDYLSSLKLPRLLNDAKFGCKIDLNSTDGLKATLIGSPIKIGKLGDIINITEKNTGTGKDKTFGWEIDFGKGGKNGKILINKLAFSKSPKSSALSAAGHFKIVEPLALPLGTVKSLLEAIGLSSIKNVLPDSIPLKEMDLLDRDKKIKLTAISKLFADEKVNKIANSFISVLPDAMITIFKKLIPGVLADDNTLRLAEIAKGGSEVLNEFINIFPDEFKEYLSFAIPDEITFNIEIGADASITGNIEMPEKTPLKLLFLGGTNLYGIQLRKFSIGNLSTMASAPVEIDAVIDQFNLLEILASQVLDTDAKDLVTRLTLKNLYLLVFYGAVVPIPIPVFYDHIGVRYKGIKGVEIGSNFKLPKPKSSVLELANTLGELGTFLTDKDATLDEKAASHPNLSFEIGSNYIELPSYLGGKVLGKNLEKGKNIAKVDAWSSVAKTLNFLKKGSINDLVGSIPLEYRIGDEELQFLSKFKITAKWMMVSVDEIKTNGTVQSFLLGNVSTKQIKKGEITKITQNSSHENKLLALVNKDSATDGALTFLAGKLEIGSLLSLEAIFGLAVTNNGFATQFQFTGKLAEIVTVNLSGGISLINDETTEFELKGASELILFKKSIMKGKLEFKKDKFHIDGKIDLFPKGSLVSLTADIDGTIGKDVIDIKSNASLKYNNTTIIDGHLIINEKLIKVEGSFLGTQMYFSFIKHRHLLGEVKFDYSINLGDIPIIGHLDNINIKLDTSIELKNGCVNIKLTAYFAVNGTELNINTTIKNNIPISLAALKETIYEKIKEKVIKEASSLFEDVFELIEDIGKEIIVVAKDLEEVTEELIRLPNKITDSISVCHKIEKELDIEAYMKNRTIIELEKLKKVKSIGKLNIEKINNKIKEKKLKIKKAELVERKRKLQRLISSGMKNKLLTTKITKDSTLARNTSFINPTLEQKAKAEKLDNYYPNLVSFSLNDKKYIAGQSLNGKCFIIKEIKLDGSLSKTSYLDEKWNNKSDTLTVLNIGEKVFVFGQSEKNKKSFIIEVLPSGELAPKKMYSESWTYYYPQLILFSIGNKNFMSGQSEDGKFFVIMKLSFDNDVFSFKTTKEWNVCEHIGPDLSFIRPTQDWSEKQWYDFASSITVVNIRDKVYLLGQSKDKTIRIWHASADGNLGGIVYEGNWSNYYANLFSFVKEGKTYVGGQSDDLKSFFIQEVHFKNDKKLHFTTATKYKNLSYGMGNLLPIQFKEDILLCGQVNAVV